MELPHFGRFVEEQLKNIRVGGVGDHLKGKVAARWVLVRDWTDFLARLIAVFRGKELPKIPTGKVVGPKCRIVA